jgi:GNAT superfamily N-acetyltransferase
MSSTEKADLDQQSYIASTMNHDDRNIGFELLKTGSAVDFRVVGKSTELAPDKENIHVRVDLAFEVEEEDEDPADVAEWAAFGFIFVLAVLSFADARPRGISEVDYSAKDDFTVADFLEGLSFGKRGLRFRADYIRGRSMKTDITVRSDGTVALTTWGRGEAALRWLDRLKGKKLMELV